LLMISTGPVAVSAVDQQRTSPTRRGECGLEAGTEAKDYPSVKLCHRQNEVKLNGMTTFGVN